MKSSNKRAGTYKKQKHGYRTFVPNPLPPDPPLNLDGGLLRILSKADLALGRLDGITEVIPNPDLFVMMYIKKEAVLSSQIEGTQASLMDVLEFEAKSLDPKSKTEVGEVVNYVRAINHGLEQIKSGKDISISLLKKLHYHLLKDSRGGERDPGKLRTIQNWIGPKGVDITKATFVPPTVSDMKLSLKQLERFIRRDDEIPPLIKTGLIHSQFETIHPFLDGNGRIGRVLMTLYLIKSGHLSRPLLYPSYYFKQNRTEYYERLQAVRDNGEWEAWVLFFLQGILESSNNAIDTSMKIVELRKEQQKMITDMLGNKSGSALKLYHGLFDNPYISVNSVVQITKLSYPNASHLTSTFEQLGILREVTGQKRNRIFEFIKYMDILNEGI